MLNYFGAEITSEGTTASIRPEPVLEGRDIQVPGDISSAAYFIAAGLLTPGSEILLKNVGINPTRAGILKVCMDMGADITLLNESTEGEPTADLVIDSHLDHRIAMSFAVAGTICDGTVEILNGECVNISYPEFYHDLYSLDSSRI